MRTFRSAVVVALLAALSGHSVQGDGQDDNGPDAHEAFLRNAFFDIMQDSMTCGAIGQLQMAWSTELGAASLAPPLIYDMFSDGNKEILSAGFTHYADAVDGRTGNDVRGWPFTHPRFRSQASPLTIDLEKDGTAEILMSTYDGELIFFRENGTAVPGRVMRLPRLVVQLRPPGFSVTTAAPHGEHHEADTVDVGEHTKGEPTASGNVAPHPKALLEEKRKLAIGGRQKFDPDAGTLAKAGSGAKLMKHNEIRAGHLAAPGGGANDDLHADGAEAPTNRDGVSQRQPTVLSGSKRGGGRTLQSLEPGADHIIPPHPEHPEHPDGIRTGDEADEQLMHGQEEYYGDNPVPMEEEQVQRLNPERKPWQSAGETGLSGEAKAAMDLVFHPELFEAAATDAVDEDADADPEQLNDDIAHLPEAERRARLEAAARRRSERSPDTPVAHDPFRMRRSGGGAQRGKEVLLDAHILATPVLADLNFDGVLDVIVPVSYFLDDEDYLAPGRGLPDTIDPDHYVAGGLVVMDIVTGKVRWKRDFPLTTKHEPAPAYVTASPVVINLGNEGLYDVIIPTSAGEIHVFNVRGENRPGWPQQLPSSIHGPVLAEDVDGDGSINICAATIKGLVRCYKPDGRMLWESTVKGGVADGMTAGDVNGDGYLDIAIATAAGQMYALDGRTGRPLPYFPVRIGPTAAPPLLLNLNDTSPPASPESDQGLHLIVAALDGRLYAVSGSTGCEAHLDIGSRSYNMVLADDFMGSGRVDLLVSTVSGGLIALHTNVPFDALSTWPARMLGPNGMTAKKGHFGVAVAPESRTPRDVRGPFFKVLFTIHDKRAALRLAKPPTARPLYFVTVTIGKRLLVFARLLISAQEYTITVPTPLERMYGTVFVTVRLPTGQVVDDSFALSFNMHFLETVKFALLIPFAATCLVLAFVRREHAVDDERDAFRSYDADDDFVYVLQGARARRWAEHAGSRRREATEP